MMSGLLPRATTYDLWQWSADEQSRAVSPTHPVVELSADDLATIDRDRPGYGPMARSYFTAGHHASGIRIDGRIVALKWHVVNESDRPRRVKGYYPLRPGHALLHAAWTHPDHRGQGLHQTLIGHDVATLTRRHPDAVLEAVILPDNATSVHNYRKAGFVPAGTLFVLSWLRWSWPRFGS